MNLNKVIIIGNLTRDPESKTIASGSNVATFSIATNRVWKDGQGQKQEQTEFHNVVAWGRLAEIAGQYLTKGQLCMVEGRLQTRNWDDQAGVKHWKTEIVAENFQMGPRRDGGSNSSNFKPSNNNTETTPTEPVENPGSDNSEEEIKVEDIPF